MEPEKNNKENKFQLKSITGNIHEGFDMFMKKLMIIRRL